MNSHQYFNAFTRKNWPIIFTQIFIISLAFICVIPRFLWKHFSPAFSASDDSSFLSTLKDIVYCFLTSTVSGERSAVICSLNVIYWFSSCCFFLRHFLCLVLFFSILIMLSFFFLRVYQVWGLSELLEFINLCVSLNLEKIQPLCIQCTFSFCINLFLLFFCSDC